MSKYNYTQSVAYYVEQCKNSVSVKQAWFYYGKVKNLTRWYELTDKQMAEHQAFLPKLGKAIEKKWGETTKTQKPTASAPAPKLASPVQPAVSKNGRTNNALRVKAVIENLKASIEILEAIK